MFEKIIFTADYISSERDWPNVEEIRNAAFKNIDEAVLIKLVYAIKKCINNSQSIDINTAELYNELITRMG